ncbi:MAG: hypothetical protein IJ419_08245 [Agathobacter sp.]|nr:hypothetical protein [Agathobacter sp.]
MKDLKINCTNQYGKRIHVEYNTIMDFLDEIEEDINNSVMNCTDVEADFFENPLHHQHFDSIQDLYNHCQRIVC